MQAIIILVLILGSALVYITIFAVRNIIKPKRIANIKSLLQQKRVSAAIKLAKQMALKDPRNCNIRYLLGKAYLANNNPDLAFREFKEVNKNGNISSHCPEKEFRKSMAALFLRFGQIEGALKEYLLLIKLEPHEGEHYYQAGLIFESRNNTERATQYYRKALELNDRHSEAHFKLGMILYRQKQFEKAKKEMEMALLFDPNNNKAYYVIGKVLKDSNRVPLKNSIRKLTKRFFVDTRRQKLKRSLSYGFSLEKHAFLITQ